LGYCKENYLIIKIIAKQKSMELLINKLNIEVLSLIILGTSFLISYFMIPKLIGVIKFKKLMDNPNSRSSHINKTPTLAGLVFYVSMVISLFFIHYYDTIDISFNIVVGLTILLIIGLKDDLVVLSVKTKIIAQLIAITFILLNHDVHTINFHGFLGISEVPFILTIGLSYMSVIFIINAYNLIDGIDGLAGMLGVMIFAIFAAFYYKMELNIYFLLSIAPIGFLVAFLRYNLSKRNKIFMGDTGSMIVGFLIGILTLRFLSLNASQLLEVDILPENKFLVVLAILFFPVIDVGRVIIVRLLNKRHPFFPDRHHLHHILIDKDLPHIKASITLTISSVFVFIAIFLVNSYFTYPFLIVVFGILTFFTFYILLVLDLDPIMTKRRKKIKSFFPRNIQIREFRIRKRIIIGLKSIFFRKML
jgi:UDP-GlcNAc:undecaprenyl-phosphate/decaprenyl-phosphate GlcNAc-1-phosphate transferase